MSMKNKNYELVETYDIDSMTGPGIGKIRTEGRGSINDFVIGEFLKLATNEKSSKSNYVEEIPSSESENNVLNLTKKGVDYLKKNVDNIIKAYHSLFSDDVKIDSVGDFSNFEEVASNGSYKLVPKQVAEPSVHEQNLFESTPPFLSGDCICDRVHNSEVLGGFTPNSVDKIPTFKRHKKYN